MTDNLKIVDIQLFSNDKIIKLTKLDIIFSKQQTKALEQQISHLTFQNIKLLTPIPTVGKVLYV